MCHPKSNPTAENYSGLTTSLKKWCQTKNHTKIKDYCVERMCLSEKI